jgi:hypothetical protein
MPRSTLLPSPRTSEPPPPDNDGFVAIAKDRVRSAEATMRPRRLAAVGPAASDDEQRGGTPGVTLSPSALSMRLPQSA